MLSQKIIKQFQSLKNKKFRQKYGLFVVEGFKSINEFVLHNWPIQTVLINDILEVPSYLTESGVQIEKVDGKILKSISNLSTAPGILAIAQMQKMNADLSSWVIALDCIQDPGNLGAIIRIADWYGISSILCSKDTADVYNPKVVQASMGSLCRVNIEYANLNEKMKNQLIYAAVLDGENLRTKSNIRPGIILIGNEANGIRKETLENHNYETVSIPKEGIAESLNAAVSAGIICERLLFA